MVKKKDLVIAILTTFCLASTMFLVQIVRSQTLGQYDPWFDMDDSGKIDVYDVAWVAKAYGTTGDPTKNVNVTNNILMVNGTDNQQVTVTNWPSSSPSSASLFPSNLNLRGTCAHNGVEHILVDNDTPYPNQNSPPPIIGSGRWDYDSVSATINGTERLIYNQTFVFEKVPTNSYQILGQLQTSMTCNITFSPTSTVSFIWQVGLFAVSTSGNYRPLASIGTTYMLFGGSPTNYPLPNAVSSEVLNPITVNAFERLAVNVTISAVCSSSTNLALLFLYPMGTDDFLTTIPIVY